MNLLRLNKSTLAQAVIGKKGKWCLLFIWLFAAGITRAYAGITSDTSHVKVKTLNNGPTNTALTQNCANIDAIYIVIEEAINIGAPTYNEGNIMGCYRIYEGAAYKIIYKYGGECKEIKDILEAALEKSYGDYSAADKAWIMRKAFDAIMGVPTTTK
jgi:hypothetical protein